jgi:hypothetical protein
VIFRPKPPIRRTHKGVEVDLPDEERRFLAHMLDELGGRLADAGDDPELRRLFPTAYHDDPGRDAEYQILARSELTDSRLASIAAMRASLGERILDDEQLGAWMAAINQLRLVLGTRLDIGEDDEGELDPDDPSVNDRVIYHYLTALLALVVEATGYRT